MIINSIRVKDFASYSSCELPLRRLGRIILVYGPTGAGKTTLLIDAVTAALFGRAYGESKRESKKWVIRPTAPKAEVELDFSIGNDRYLLRRTIPRKGLGAVELLKIWDGGEERLATGEQAVVAKVEHLIGLNYITFLNTVAVRQGQVDELLRAGPHERRDVFLRAFGIDFTRYKEKAREKRDAVKVEISETEGKIGILRDQIEKLPTIELQLQKAEKAFLKVKNRLKKLRMTYADIQKRSAKLETQRTYIEKKLARVREKEKRAEEIETQLEEKLVEKEQLKEGSKKIQKLEEKLKEDKRTHTMYSRIHPKIIQIHDLRREFDTVQRRLHTLKEKISQLPSLLAELKKARKANRLLPACRAKLEKVEKSWRRTSDELSRTQGKLNEIEKAMEVLDRAIRTGEEKCPVCMKPLDAKDAEAARVHLGSERKACRYKLRKLQREESRLQTLSRRLREKCDSLQREGAKLGLLEKQTCEIKREKREFQQLKARLAQITRQIDSMEEEVKKELGKVPTKKETEKEIQRLNRRIEEEEKELGRLREVPGKLISLEKSIEELKKDHRRLCEEIEKAKPIKEKEKELEIEYNKLKKREREISEEIEKKREELGRIKGEMTSLEKQKEEIKNAKQELQRLEKDVSEKKLLEQAYECLYSQVFHERGLPVVLVKKLLEEVEVTAREYLGRLLPGFDLFLDANKEGHIKIDVLDKEIIRPLETYSGGEKVILGFVLRLAIARAMTSGMRAFPPKYLLIDEGFGPLSAEFRHSVLRALTELSTQYDQIVIVSHMEDIREHPSFDSFVKIVKDEAGTSHVELRGRFLTNL